MKISKQTHPFSHVQLWICRWRKRLWRGKVCWEAFDFNYCISPRTPKRLTKRFDKSFVPAPKFAANLLLLQLKLIGVIALDIGTSLYWVTPQSKQGTFNHCDFKFCGAPSQFWNGSYCAAFIVFTAQEQVDQYLHVLAHQEGCFQVHKDQLSDCRAYPCEYTVMTLISQLSFLSSHFSALSLSIIEKPSARKKDKLVLFEWSDELLRLACCRVSSHCAQSRLSVL